MCIGERLCGLYYGVVEIKKVHKHTCDVDSLSKYAVFISTPKECTIEVTEKFFMDNVIKYWGLPVSLVGDRDSHFASIF